MQEISLSKGELMSDVQTEPSSLKGMMSKIIPKSRIYSGFMIAFQRTNPATFGFNFLVSSNDEYLGVFGKITKPRNHFVLEHFYITSQMEAVVDEFAKKFIQKSAVLSGISCEKMAIELEEKRFLWQFIGYIDGKMTEDQTASVWQELWKHINEEIILKTPNFSGLSESIKKSLLRRLTACVKEGQISLK